MTDARISLEKIVAALVPRVAAALAVYARWEYTVAGVTPGPPVLISGVPVSASCPFGPLANITLWPGPDGGYAIPAPGSMVLVEFHDGSATKPAVCGLDPSVPPILTTLAGGLPGEGVVRITDIVTITQAAILASGMSVPSIGPVTITSPLIGTIGPGSLSAVCG